MWRSRAACRDTDPSIFFNPKTVRAALAVCSDCAVVRSCAAYRRRVEAEANGPACGVWAGIRWAENTSRQRAEVGRVA